MEIRRHDHRQAPVDGEDLLRDREERGGSPQARRRRATMSACFATLLAIAAGIPSIVSADVTEDAGRMCMDARIANAWRVLRAVDCARCHGKDYAGLAAPSIVGYAATQSRETFFRMVLDGDPIRGMPGYRSNAYVSESLDDIYGYFRARSDGDIGPEYRPLPTSSGSAPAGSSECLGEPARARAPNR
jgi:cytochrome c55X